jgi:hypothetical protein
MLGMGFKQSYLRIAVVTAVLLHLAVLSWRIQWATDRTDGETRLTIALQKEEQTEQRQEPEPPLPEKLTPARSAEPPVADINELITKDQDQTNEQTEVRLQTSPQSDLLRKFILTEARQRSTTSPDEVAQFGETFESTYQKYESPIEIPKEAIPRGTGLFIAEVKGKRRCYSKVDSLLEPTETPSLTSKDCARKPKFNLNLGAPNNGWMDR